MSANKLELQPKINKNEKIYFKEFDLIIYLFLIFFLCILIFMIKNFSCSKASNVEIYVNNKLVYVQPLIEKEKKVFIKTDIGGVNVLFINKKVRVISSNSPRKLCVKQGFIQNVGEVIVGIPDKLLIKIIGDSTENYDFILH